mmetsp:Transcript_39267/g.124645  ORF Transcript_39267/g.124645 Transcript_39267/m.124645 type:complete len:199 (+) Transcript_39267:376-972(+)
MVSNPYTGKVFTVEMHHPRVGFANSSDNVGMNIKGLDKTNMPCSGDVMVYKKDTTLDQTRGFDAHSQVLDIPNEIKVGYFPIVEDGQGDRRQEDGGLPLAEVQRDGPVQLPATAAVGVRHLQELRGALPCRLHLRVQGGGFRRWQEKHELVRLCVVSLICFCFALLYICVQTQSSHLRCICCKVVPASMNVGLMWRAL